MVEAGAAPAADRPRRHPLRWFLVLVPAAPALELLHAPPVWVFGMSALAIIPLAGLLGEATEHLAARVGPGLGGLLNATLGNAAEMILALIALRKGMYDVVKASITGSIIGNILLVFGLSALLGGLKYRRQEFNATAAGMGTTLLALSVVGLVVPALFHQIVGPGGQTAEHHLSLYIAGVLFLTYILGLVFSLRTHKDLYDGAAAEEARRQGPIWSRKRAAWVLIAATVGVAFLSELLVDAVKPTAERFGWTEVFVGVILVAIIGNAAEHSAAVLVALKNQMDLAIHIAVGSSIQIALFVAPLLVFASYLFGPPMDLLFTTFEVMAVGFSVWILSLIARDGQTNWMEGVQLLAVYGILAIAFFYLP